MGAEAAAASAVKDKVEGVVGMGMGVVQAIQARKREKKAQKALENLPIPELNNAFKNQQVSTIGADLRKQEAGRNSASAIGALRGGGARAIIGGIGKVQANNNQVNAEIGANLDEQQKDINMNIAQDETNLRGYKEDRYRSDVSALSSQLNSAINDKKQGIGNAIKGAYGIGGSMNTGASGDSSVTGKSNADYKKQFGNPTKFSKTLKG